MMTLELKGLIFPVINEEKEVKEEDYSFVALALPRKCSICSFFEMGDRWTVGWEMRDTSRCSHPKLAKNEEWFIDRDGKPPNWCPLRR